MVLLKPPPTLFTMIGLVSSWAKVLACCCSRALCRVQIRRTIVHKLIKGLNNLKFRIPCSRIENEGIVSLTYLL